MFNPAQGGEIRKRRPAVLVRSDTSNCRLNRVQVVPPANNTSRIYPNEALEDVNGTCH